TEDGSMIYQKWAWAALLALAINSMAVVHGRADAPASQPAPDAAGYTISDMQLGRSDRLTYLYTTVPTTFATMRGAMDVAMPKLIQLMQREDVAIVGPCLLIYHGSERSTGQFMMDAGFPVDKRTNA